MYPECDSKMTERTKFSSRSRQNCRISISRWRSHFPLTYYVFLCSMLIFQNVIFVSCENAIYTAKVNVTYYDDIKNSKSSIWEMGVFGNDETSRVHSAPGLLVHVRTGDNKTDACNPITNAPSNKRWVALVQRGSCTLPQKVQTCYLANASAVIIYDNEEPKSSSDYSAYNLKGNILAIFVTKSDGHKLLGIMKDHKEVNVQILEGHLKNVKSNTDPSTPTNISKTSVMFVSISFVVLMIISLAWLVFYYIQRFRYAHAKERLSRRLASAAKKAIAKIPQRTLKGGDKELDPEFDQCAVCIEGYKTSDVVRTLPCKHIFHKSCVDPWLLDQRSCPMCKLDILRAYGMHVSHLNSSQESVHAEPDSNELTASGLDGDPIMISSEDRHHHHREGVEVLLISHPSVHYHGSDTFCDDSGEREALTEPPSPTESEHEVIDIEPDSDSENECSERNSLMSGEKSRSYDKMGRSSSLLDTSDV